MRIAIGALSGWQHHERRELCRTTWMRDARAMGVPSMFLLGSAMAAKVEEFGPHALVLPCPDDYLCLPQRTWHWCRWALKLPSPACRTRQEGRGAGGEGWDYLFKCDDDTYISMPRLADYAARELAGRDYVGAEWREGVGYGSGGAGYFLSRRAAALVAERLEASPTGAEDLLVGRILAAAGIELAIEPRLVPFGSMEHRPLRENRLITVHGVAAEVFLACHAETGAGNVE